MCSLVHATLIQYHIDTGSRCCASDSSPFESGRGFTDGHIAERRVAGANDIERRLTYVRGYARSQIRRGRA